MVYKLFSGEYDGYAECVRVDFDEEVCSVDALMQYLFEIIDPYSINKQGVDEGQSIGRGFIVLWISILRKLGISSPLEMTATG